MNVNSHKKLVKVILALIPLLIWGCVDNAQSIVGNKPLPQMSYYEINTAINKDILKGQSSKTFVQDYLLNHGVTYTDQTSIKFSPLQNGHFKWINCLVRLDAKFFQKYSKVYIEFYFDDKETLLDYRIIAE